MPKAVWTGSIQFALVNIPIKLYPAVEPRTINFRMLHSECFTPIKLKRYCPTCKKEVPLSEIVKGLKYRDNEYYVFTQEELETIKLRKGDYLQITEFVNADEIKPLLVEKCYYVVPQKKNERAFFLLQEAMAETNKAAIGKLILRDKEHLVALEPFENGMLLIILHYAYEIKDIAELKELAEKVRIEAKEKALAIELIEKLSSRKGKLNLSKYKDSFREELEKLLEKKARGEKIKVKAIARIPKEKNLLKALKESLKAVKK